VFISEERLTQFSLADLFSRESENRYQFGHDFDDHFGHRGSGLLDLRINHEPPNKAFDAFKDLDKGVIAFPNGLRRLVIPVIRRAKGDSVEGTYG
jgi:hypothetical protein